MCPSAWESMHAHMCERERVGVIFWQRPTISYLHRDMGSWTQKMGTQSFWGLRPLNCRQNRRSDDCPRLCRATSEVACWSSRGVSAWYQLHSTQCAVNQVERVAPQPSEQGIFYQTLSHILEREPGGMIAPAQSCVPLYFWLWLHYTHRLERIWWPLLHLIKE